MFIQQITANRALRMDSMHLAYEKQTLLNMTCILHMKNQIQLTLIWSPDVDGDDDFDSESSQSRDMYVTTSLKLSTR